jgi:hypothetical protein
MTGSSNPFIAVTGSDKLTRPQFVAAIIGLAVLSAYIIGSYGITVAVLLIFIPFAAAFLFYLFRFPVLGLYSVIAYSFISLGIGRYIKGVELGMIPDLLLLLTYISLIFNKFNEKLDLSPARKDVTLLAFIWAVYVLLQLINPEARSFSAFISGRSVGFYMILIVPLTLLLIDTNRKLDIILYLWAFLSLLATLKGIGQIIHGADQWELEWLNRGNIKTHVIFGRLRAFSFMSDAGQFGANQAFTGVVATILATAMKGWKKRLLFIAVALFAFYGMVISGTRGAISVPIVGFAAYFFLRKNKIIMVIGFFLLVGFFAFFKFTTIGQSNYNIRRMRSAFDINDPSFQVRLHNQRLLRDYMSSRPFGGGLGHGGVKAQKFLPDAFLSQIPTDSWYVLVWVELGIVGLLLHLFILFYILAKSSYRIMYRIRDPLLKLKMTALTAGISGVLVSSYGNAVLGQMPTSVLVYVSMALIMNSEVFDKAPEEHEANIAAVNVKSKRLQQNHG